MYDIDTMAEQIRSSGRRRRPGGRWSNPASPLQAARFELRKNGKEVVTAIRQLCKGHAMGRPCRIDVSKLSDYECGNRRPGLEHIEAFCRLYQRSPEQLGLITWRDEPATPSNGAVHNGSGANGVQGAEPDGSAQTTTGNLDDSLTDDVEVAEVGEVAALVELLSETAALTAATTQLLRATLDGRGAEGLGGPTVRL